ncbi:site-specific integrase [Ralstonia solanacearum]|nr:site-specific integrase [Ralstonia solanacearum]
MNQIFTASELRASTGEHFAILLCEHDGQRLPLYWPNLFASTQLRARSLATNTILLGLQSLGLLYQWATINEIDLDHELVHGDFLSLSQVELLASDLRYAKRYLVTAKVTTSRLPLANLESVRRRKQEPVRHAVSAKTAADRIADVTRYLEWHAKRRIALIANTQDALLFKTLSDSVIAQLKELKPTAPSGDADIGRTGLLPAERKILLEAIRPDSPNNPFRGEFNRHRNYLYLMMLYQIGHRRGESLQMKVEDIDVHGRKVRIHRSADDASDPRSEQPRTKTLARTVPISSDLAEELYDYIGGIWSCFPIPKRRHGFLWTTSNGVPLALSTVNDMFRRLREKVPGLPSDLTPHSLRHDWNERFSEKIDSLPAERKPGDTKETEVRSHLMGWKSNSNVVAQYTRRFIRAKAAEISEQMANAVEKPVIRGRR